MSTPVKQKPAVQHKMPRPAAKVRNDKVRSKTRVNIGIAFKKWKKLRSEKAMKSDAELALYLLDSNEKHRQVFPTLLFPHAPPSDENPPPSNQVKQLPVDTERMIGAPETLEQLKRKEQLPVENPSPTAAPEVRDQQERMTTEDEAEGSSGSRHSAADSCSSPQQGTTSDDSDDSEYSEHTAPRKDKPEVISSEDRDQEFLGKRLMYNCQDCGRTFRANQTLTAHRNIYHLPPKQPEEPPDQPKPPKTYKCTTCSKVFQTSGGLSRHRIIHSGIKPFKCTFCGRGFTQVGNLKTHQKVHRGEKPTDAAPQKKGSSTTEGGEQPSGESHFCRVCWTQFSDKGLLEEHAKRSHGSNRRLPCTECRWTFANAEKLQQHQAMHKAPKPHQCSQCSKGYRTAVALKDHMRDHTGEKPFVCNICGRRFKRESSIKSHYAAHSRARPHLCFVCGKSYGRAEQLKVHMRVHTGERPYQCNDCHRSFYYKEGLLSHVKVHIAKPIGPTRKRGRPAFSRRM